MIKSALVIRERWINLILAGDKTWEMRSTRTHKRGRIGLVRRGSGLVIGTANLTDSLEPLTEENYAEYHSKHRIPDPELPTVFASNWFYPWVLEDVQRLPEPVRYKHKSGAVTFVNLDDEVAIKITRQLHQAD